MMNTAYSKALAEDIAIILERLRYSYEREVDTGKFKFRVHSVVLDEDFEFEISVSVNYFTTELKYFIGNVKIEAIPAMLGLLNEINSESMITRFTLDVKDGMVKHRHVTSCFGGQSPGLRTVSTNIVFVMLALEKHIRELTAIPVSFGGQAYIN